MSGSTKHYIEAAELLAPQRPQIVEIALPEFGGKLIRLKGMTAAESDAWLTENTVTDATNQEPRANNANVRARFLVRVIVDAQGQRIYKDEDATLLGALPTSVVQRLWKAAAALNQVDGKAFEGN